MPCGWPAGHRESKGPYALRFFRDDGRHFSKLAVLRGPSVALACPLSREAGSRPLGLPQDDNLIGVELTAGLNPCPTVRLKLRPKS